MMFPFLLDLDQCQAQVTHFSIAVVRVDNLGGVAVKPKRREAKPPLIHAQRIDFYVLASVVNFVAL